MVEQRRISVPVSINEVESWPLHPDDYCRLRSGLLNYGFVTCRDLPDVARRELGLKSDSVCLELHVPVLLEPSDDPRLILQAFRVSFIKLAGKIKRRNIQFPYLMGITYERLAKAAKLFGFSIFEIGESDLDQSFLSLLRESYDLTTDSAKGKLMGRVFVCYQPYDQFMAKFAGNGNS